MNNTIAGVLASAQQQFNWGDQTKQDQQFLLQHVAKLTRAQCISYSDKLLSQIIIDTFLALCARCQQGEPVAYVIGIQTFWDLDLHVNRQVLIPRGETELLVRTILAYVPDDPITLVDLGTGSGALAVTLSRLRPHWFCMGMDKSWAALQVAKVNSQQYAPSVALFQGDWLEAFADQSVDVVVSNPPYLAPWDPHLQSTGLAYEPQTALVAPDAGLAHFLIIIRTAKRVLRPGGWLFLEHGWRQGQVIYDLLKQEGYQAVSTMNDYANHPRVSFGRITSLFS